MKFDQERVAAMIAMRRELHSRPEPGWCEVLTASKVIDALEEAGVDIAFGRKVIDAQARLGLPPDDVLDRYYDEAVRAGARRDIADELRSGFTGIVGTIRGAKPGPVIAVRMDMDANLGRESDDADHPPAKHGFRSQYEGVHHNCGHDGHTVIGLALARAIARRRSELCGELRLIFQPAEEGLRGAAAMVAAGVLENVDLFFGFHIGVQALEHGELVAGYRNILASTKLDAIFSGRPAHAGLAPHLGRNAVLAAAIATQALLALPRHGQGDTRINVGRISGGDSRNTIPSSACLELEIRADSTEVLSFLNEMAERAILGAAQTQDVSAVIELRGQSCAGNSDEDLTHFVAEIGEKLDCVRKLRLMDDFKGSDDAAIMMDAVQKAGGRAVYMGFGSPLGAVHHNPRFEFEEDVLPFGAAVLEEIVMRTHLFSESLKEGAVG
jgi:aminobenzoyl-glutamate utilization protein A